MRGYKALLAMVTTGQAAPVIVAQRLRKGATGSARGAKRLIYDALTTVTNLRSATARGRCPSGKFTANAAWLVLAVVAFNLTRAAATLTGPALAKATTGTIRAKLIYLPARIASLARRLTLHLPPNSPSQDTWTDLFTQACGAPAATT